MPSCFNSPAGFQEPFMACSTCERTHVLQKRRSAESWIRASVRSYTPRAWTVCHSSAEVKRNRLTAPVVSCSTAK